MIYSWQSCHAYQFTYSTFIMLFVYFMIVAPCTILDTLCLLEHGEIVQYLFYTCPVLIILNIYMYI